ncbi:MAG TPA: hypothetical protein VGD54_07100 [Steroidobacteraceae bacterium]
MNSRLSKAIRCGVPLALCMFGTGTIAAADDADESPSGTLVPKAVCGREDHPETGLQGQVPASLRATGFKGFNCNLKLIGQSRNDGGNWQSAEFRDKRQEHGVDSDERDRRSLHTCGYFGSASANVSPTTRNPATLGTRVVDLTDPNNPVLTGHLQSISMLDPWESLRVNQPRKLLVADQASNGGGGPAVDVYDISEDCRFPQLLASVPIGTGKDGGPLAPVAPTGHEGAFAPDGLTYYIGDITSKSYYAVDVTDPTQPKYIALFDMKTHGLTTHGLSVSDDGNRLYVDSPGTGTNLANPDGPNNNGFAILDVSEVQARAANPQIKLISTFLYKDGSAGQHTIPVTIKGRRYVIQVDEGGGGGLPPFIGQSWAQTCQAGILPFPTARIVDVDNETKPKLVSKLVLEMNDPAKCAQVIPDLVGLSIFTYGTHYCSVDNRHNATTLACDEFNSGIRVFDIRNPRRPKEIAYFNPAGVTTPSGGSNHLSSGNWIAGGPDWCSAQLHLDAEAGTLWTTCQDNGLLMLKFERGVWPFEDSTTPPGQQN